MNQTNSTPGGREARFPLAVLKQVIGEERKRIDLSGVEGHVLPYLVTRIRNELRRPILVVTPKASDARRFTQDLEFLAARREQIEHLATIDASPFGHLSPDRNAVMRLMGSLARLAWNEAGPVMVASADTLARRLMSVDTLVDHCTLISIGEILDRSECLRSLADAGYRTVSTVEDPGTFAIRGGIIDVFAPQMKVPVRIELWGDEVESLRLFDPNTQRTLGSAGDQLILPPVREELFVRECIDRAREAILDAGAEVDLPTRTLQPILDDLSNGIPFMGVEGYRPAFYSETATLFDYLPANTLFLVYDPMSVGEESRTAWDLMQAARERALTNGHPSLAPELHRLSPNDVSARLNMVTQLRCHVIQMVDEIGAVEGPTDAIVFDVPTNQSLTHALNQSRGDQIPLRPLAVWIREQMKDGVQVVLSCRQQTQLDRLERLLKNFGIPTDRTDASATDALAPGQDGAGRAVLVRGEAAAGFRLLEHGIALITEADIFGSRAPKRRAKRKDATSPFIQDFKELKTGDHVVHADHGIGRYSGLKKLVLGAHEHDCLIIEFASQDKLYLPVYKLGRLQKYSGGDSSPKIDKLGGTAWQKVRARAKKAAEEDALALLDLYAKRELASGYAFSQPDDLYRTFEATFPFEETPDQLVAIDEVIADMCSGRPMDRLLCGDVGFGKTEVALRAAMKAVVDGKQVCVLVPTTVLALQHFKTFSDRLKGYPIEIKLFSRLVSRGDLRDNLDTLGTGRVDIAIGTHRLLGKDVVFKDIGLLILDEEHRFGVKHKERLKEFRTNVDVLAMTATPIPRTLQLSLSGIRDLSTITTPPVDRLSVRTYVCRATDEVVRDAILRELGRGGQVFFVHNRVQSIESRAAWLASLVPEARIVIGHGQMDPQKLEKVMVDFTEGRFNILVATTIIESGIDIPTANTMLIDQADRFGLAQLYQLRGRVGRSRERGFCYLLVPGQAAIDREARARLAVIQKFTELGSGFQVASHDLELRGAGELLGTSQKGHVQAVGIDLYAQLLDDAVRTLRGEAPKASVDPDLNIQVNARIPETYVPDHQLRLMLYKRLANAPDEERVISIAEEMVDRFGSPPGPLENLIEAMRIRTLARSLLIETVDHSPNHLMLTFNPQTPLPVDAIIGLVRAPGSQFRVPADFKLVYQFDSQEKQDTLRALRICLQRLAELVTEPSEESNES